MSVHPFNPSEPPLTDNRLADLIEDARQAHWLVDQTSDRQNVPNGTICQQRLRGDRDHLARGAEPERQPAADHVLELAVGQRALRIEERLTGVEHSIKPFGPTGADRLNLHDAGEEADQLQHLIARLHRSFVQLRPPSRQGE